MHCRNGLGGFTFIEMMMVVAIATVLTVIALPSYRQQVMRSKITEATATLSLKRILLEQFFQDNRSYDGASACAADSSSSSFNFSCTTLSATTYILQAQGKNMMLGFTYTLDQLNNKSTLSVPANWTASSDCWITKADGTC